MLLRLLRSHRNKHREFNSKDTKTRETKTQKYEKKTVLHVNM